MELIEQELYQRVLTSIERLEPERLAIPRRGAKRALAPYKPSQAPDSRDDSSDLPNVSLTYSSHLQLEFVVGLQGCAELAMDGQRYTLTEGDVAIVPSHTPHLERIYSRRQDYHLLWLCLWPNRLTIHSSLYHRANRFQVVRRACIPRHNTVWRCMESAAEEALACSPYWLSLARARLVEGLVLALRQMDENGSGLNARQFQRSLIDTAKAYMQVHFSEDLTLECIAARASLSPSYFSALFSRCEQKTVFDYLHEIRVDEAKRLLADTALPVKQIARRVGVTSPAYFCRLFRRLTGQAPQDYRSIQLAAQVG